MMSAHKTERVSPTPIERRTKRAYNLILRSRDINIHGRSRAGNGVVFHAICDT